MHARFGSRALGKATRDGAPGCVNWVAQVRGIDVAPRLR